MEKLTNADINELTYWFATPAPSHIAGHLAAQNYEPRPSGVYDPTTDHRLENLVSAASSRAQSDWSRIQRTMLAVADGADGRSHVEVLRRAFSPLPSHTLRTEDFRYPEVATVTATAQRLGLELARSDEHVRLLEVATVDALRDGVSPMTVAQRTVLADGWVCERGIIVTGDMLRAAVWRTLYNATHGKTKTLPQHLELCANVRSEMLDLVAAAGDAYRRARAALGASKREAKADARKEREKLLDDMLGKKRAKESARFEAKVRRSA